MIDSETGGEILSPSVGETLLRLIGGFTGNLILLSRMDRRRGGGRFRRVMQCLAESNAECSLNIQYTLSDPGRLQPMLIESAAANARKKALALCAAQGVKLGELLRIDCDWQEISISSGSRFSRDAFAPVLACTIAKFSPEEIHAGDTATFIWAIESDPGNP